MQVSAAPLSVRGAGVLVGIQGLAGIAFAVALLVRAFGGEPATGGNLFGEAAYFAVLGGGVLACGAGLLLGKTWARTPATVVEILLLGVSWYAIGPSGRPEFGLPVAAVCVLVLVLLFVAPSRQWALGEDEDVSPPPAE
jgi:peptidoglycan/LPS O-acetylase OafA/YrhL